MNKAETKQTSLESFLFPSDETSNIPL